MKLIIKLAIALSFTSCLLASTASSQWLPLSLGYKYNDSAVSTNYPFVVVAIKAQQETMAVLDCSSQTFEIDGMAKLNETAKKAGERLLYKFCRAGDEALPKGFYQLGYTGKDFNKFAAWLDTRSKRVDVLGNLHVTWRLIPRFPVAYAWENEQLDNTLKREQFAFATIRTTVICAERFLRGDSVEFYDANGKLLEEKVNGNAGKYVDADTFGAELVAEVCKK